MDSSTSEFGHIHCCKKWFESKFNNRMSNSVDPKEMTRNELSHLDLLCLHRCIGLQR